MKLLYKVVRAVLIGLILGVGGLFLIVVASMPTHKLSDDEVQEIYKTLLVQTGQSQDRIPLIIVDAPVLNAYTDGKGVYIYRGILDYTKNNDEVALILGHELAHKMLGHTEGSFTSPLEISVAEANADKMGAFYMLKAGYDICTARQIWLRFQHDNGDYQGGDHPTYIYRYDQLNVNCL